MKQFVQSVFLLLLPVLFVSVQSHAQVASMRHLNGYIGFDYLNNTLKNNSSGGISTANTNQNLMLDTNVSGATNLGEYVGMTGGWNLGKGNSYAQTDSADVNWGANAHVDIFQGSRIPVTMHYARNSGSLTGTNDNSDSKSKSYGFSWGLRLPRLPELSLNFDHDSNDVLFSTSLSDTNYNHNSWRMGSEYSLLGFRLTGSGMISGSANHSAFDGDPRPAIQTQAHEWTANSFREFGKVQWITTASDTAVHLLQSSGPTQEDDLFAVNSRLALPISKKVTGTLNYVLLKQDLTVSTGVGTGPLQSQTGGGSVTIMPMTGLTISQSASAAYMDQTSSYEYGSRSINETTVATLTRKLKGVDTSVSGAVGYDNMLSSLGKVGSALTYNFSLRGAWGNVSRARFSGLGAVSRQGTASEIGGYSADKHFDFTVESLALLRMRSEAGIRYRKGDTLNLTGLLHQSGTDFYYSAERENLALRVARQFGAGDGLLYSAEEQYRSGFIVSLPSSSLLLVPAVASTSRGWSVESRYRIFSNFSIHGAINNHSVHYTGYDQTLRTYDLSGHYTLGRVFIESSWGHYHDLHRLPVRNTLAGNRMYIRIARDFNFF